MSSGLIDAIRDCKTERVAAYLLAGADPNFIEDNDRVTPLHHAAQFENPFIIELLVVSGANIFSKTTYDTLTPIEVACLNENWISATVLASSQQYLVSLATLAWYLRECEPHQWDEEPTRE